MAIKVSVVIPVFNAEMHLEKCIESLINQTLKECEFIFVNDGSVDRSGSILDRFRLVDDRIRVLHQENKGVSRARNKGVKEAKGEYIGFVDADDSVAPNFFEKMYTCGAKENCEVLLADFESEINGLTVLSNFPFKADKLLDSTYIQTEVIPYLLKSDNLNSVCNKVYIREVIINNTIEFSEELNLGEDGLFNLHVFTRASSFKYIKYTGYYYKYVKGSATRKNNDISYFKQALEVYNRDLPESITNLYSIEQLNTFKSIKLVSSAMSLLNMYGVSVNLSNTEKIKIIEEIIFNSEVRKALYGCWEEIYHQKGRYERFLMMMIKYRSSIGIYGGVIYSKIKSKKR